MKQTKDKEKINASLLKECAILKSKIAYSLGSLETINYLLKNDNPEILGKNLEHLRNTVNKVLDELKKNP